MNHFLRPLLRVLLVSSAFLAPFAAGQVVPNVDPVARVKEHRQGAQGNVVEGEESMRKLLLQWDAIPNAVAYEVCHNCDDKGENGDIVSVGIGRKYEKGNKPVFIRPNVPLGRNTFQVRASVTTGEWGAWSEPRIFYVDDEQLGDVEHQHEEL